MARQELDEQKEDLLVTVVDIQPTNVHTVSGDNLYPSQLEVSAMNGALVFLVPPPDLGDVLIEGRPMQIEAELDVGVRGGPQSERVHPLAHEPVKRADHRLSMTAGRPCGAPSTARRLLTGVSHGRCTSADLVQPNLRKCSET